MSASQTGGPPPPGLPAAPAELAEKLRQLRGWAGQPSLRRLRQLGGLQRTADGADQVDALPESTTSYVLRGGRPASAEFVRSFVTACLRARRRDQRELAEQLEWWHQAWLAASGRGAVAAAGPAAGSSAEPAAGPPPATLVPRQLPPGASGFTGRAAEQAALAELPPEPGTAAPAPVVVAITGTAGVGKTALAVHAAHRTADRFPDGELFIDLHGFTEGIAPVEPGAALDRLLRALGVPAERTPAGLDDRAALWRSVLAGRRMLILLDNAATEQQVSPLLPGAAGCLVLVTSRRRLAGLDATHLVRLDVLPADDALALFAHAAGQDWTGGDPPEPAAELVELCGRLPLAIRIAAARLRSHPAWSVADLAGRLRDQDRRLAELADHPGPRSVAAALAVSYRQLPADQQRLYRRLSLHPGTEFDRYATAALLGTTGSRAERLLNRLLDAHLLLEPVPDRYTFHDLVRAHATRLAADPEARRGRAWCARRQRRRALTRLLDYYRHSASVAMDAAYPYERGRRPAVRPARTPVPDLPGRDRATRWLDTELPNLLAAARYAAGHGWPEHTCQLSALLHRHLRTRGRYHDAEALHHQALATGRRAGAVDALLGLGHVHQLQGRCQPALDALHAAHRLAHATGNHPGQHLALTGLGWVHAGQGRYGPAADRFQQALDLARTTGDRAGQLDALVGLGRVHQMQGRCQPALDALHAAHRLARTTGNHPGQLNALVGLGRVHRLRGDHEQAFVAFTQALEIARTTGDRNGELNALRGLGHLHLVARRDRQAGEALAAALEIARTTGSGTGELSTLVGLGHVHRRRDQPEQAACSYRAALRLAEESGDRNWEFEAVQGLGRLHDRTGHPDLALAHHRRALALATQLGQPADQVRAHDGLAHAHRALGQHEPAREHWRSALEILGGLGTDHTDDDEASAATIRAHLAGLPGWRSQDFGGPACRGLPRGRHVAGTTPDHSAGSTASA
jgi:tetratricopeptide (TPR) repeat protein